MARIRSIYPSFAHDAKVKRLSRDARLTFLLMLPEADDEGRMPGSGKWLAGTLYEDDDDVTPAKVLRWVGEMIREGMVSPYEVDRAKYLHIVKFKTYQRPKHPTPSKLPPPPGQAPPPPPNGTGPDPFPSSRGGATPGATPGAPHPNRGSASPPVVVGVGVGVGVEVEPPSSSSDSRPPPPGDDDDHEAVAIEAAVEAQLRDRKRPQVVAKEGAIADVEAWKAGTRAKIVAALATGDRSVLAPPPKPSTNGRPPDPLEATAAAARALAERNDRRLRGEPLCGKCRDEGLVEREDGDVERCSCATSRASA